VRSSLLVSCCTPLRGIAARDSIGFTSGPKRGSGQR